VYLGTWPLGPSKWNGEFIASSRPPQDHPVGPFVAILAGAQYQISHRVLRVRKTANDPRGPSFGEKFDWSVAAVRS
jgi:hypothetical protein